VQYIFRLVFSLQATPQPASVGHAKREHRARSGLAAEDDRRADSVGTLAHPEHTPVAALPHRGIRVEPGPVIPDGEDQLSPAIVQIDHRVRCFSMFADVSERFLYDPEALRIDPGEQARPAPSCHAYRARAVAEDAAAGLLARPGSLFRPHPRLSAVPHPIPSLAQSPLAHR